METFSLPAPHVYNLQISHEHTSCEYLGKKTDYLVISISPKHLNLMQEIQGSNSDFKSLIG